MKTSRSKSGQRWWMWATIVASLLLMNSAFAPAQDAKNAGTEKAAAGAAADNPAAAPNPSADKPTAAPAGDNQPAAPTAGEKTAEAPPASKNTPLAEKAAEETPANKAPASVTSAPDQKAAPPATAASETKNASDSSLPAGKSDDSIAAKAAEGTSAAAGQTGKAGWHPWAILLILLALFIVPIMVGNYLARIWKMPDHGWKMALSLGVLAGSIIVCLFGQFKYGPDLAGGITLIYELQDTPKVAANANSQAPGQPKDAQQIKSGGRQFTMNKLIGGLKKRLDPDGTKEITIREYGPAVEIIIPQVGQDEMDYVKEKITKMGQLEFRITADPNIPKDKTKIELAKRLPPTESIVMQSDQPVAKWVPYDVNEFGAVDQPNGYVKRMAGNTPEILVLLDPMNVTGDYLTSATKGMDEHGGPAVHFAFNSAGAQRFERLTGQNVPNPATPDVFRHLGILLDGRLVNAPTIRSAISDRGMISGGAMSDRDVELTVEVLDAGSLPAALNKTPISQELISPTLGGQTVEQGKRAIIASLIGVMLFMLVYYRFAGMIACLALVLNLVMVLALMVLIKAAFTLPGIAGLALSVGMSVDTNVLIYERIREELASGAALRMAIRNGFDRAMRAIIDTHLTTIISGVVLFYVGTDQVKGFAVTLILGIVTNLFSAFFCTRLMFDISERLGFIKELRMMHIFSNPNYDFLRLRWVFLVVSWMLIGIGMVAVYMRGSQLLDIDFTGGSSVTFTLNDKDAMSLTDVRNALVQTELADKNLLIVELGNTGTTFTVDTSLQEVDEVKGVLTGQFGEKLKKYTVDVKDLKPVAEGNFNGIEGNLAVNAGPAYQGEEGISHDALHDQISQELAKAGHPNAQITLTNPNYRAGSGVRYPDWKVRIAGVDETVSRTIFQSLEGRLENTPLFPLANTIGGRVSGNMQFQAFLAIGISLIAMIIYLWFRFQKPSYGIAAGIALIHDVLFTIGMIALSYYIVLAVPRLAEALMIDSFQINLTIVAALLTIIGFSVNDTIVTFDRLREIKGKTPQITAKMVNDSVNQTLGRTILTVFSVFIVVLILYVWGGEGLHSFAFAFLIGVIVGTYSSIYVAAPMLLWLSGVSAAPAAEAPAPARGMQPAR